MHVETLNIENIRSYKKAKLDFSPTINLLLGANNSGKSTILKCIQTLQQNGNSLTKDDIRKGIKTGKVHIRISNIPETYSKLLSLTKNVTYKDIVWGSYILEDKTKHKHESVLIDHIRQNLFLHDKIEIVTTGALQTDPKTFRGFSAMEDENNFIYPFLSKRKTQYYSGQGGRDTAYNISDDLRNLPSRIQNLANGSHFFHEEFTQHCLDILGFKIAKVPGNTNNHEDKLGVFATTSETIFLESMGEGVANILGLLSILLTEDNKLFLIEELENDIHPGSLKKLLDLIIEKSKTNQFIISTHSNIVLKYLATVPEAKIFYTNWDIEINTADKTKIPTTTISEIENAPTERLQILENLGYDLFDFDLHTSYLILEESSAESIIKKFLIPEFVPELNSRLKTIAANGAGDLPARFDDFLRLFVFVHSNPVYHHKAWVIADGDPAGLENIEKLKVKFPTWSPEYFMTFSKDYFEEYYPDKFRDEFITINAIQDKRKKKQEKAELTIRVLHWIDENRLEAIETFRETAKEVIAVLQNINDKLKK